MSLAMVGWDIHGLEKGHRAQIDMIPGDEEQGVRRLRFFETFGRFRHNLPPISQGCRVISTTLHWERLKSISFNVIVGGENWVL